jgi:hypothetical protein
MGKAWTGLVRRLRGVLGAKNGFPKPKSLRRRPFFEALEPRLTPTTFIPVPDRNDLIFDPTRDVLYITTASGLVQRWDMATQKLLTPWNVGGILEGGDITQDGKYLYVADGVPVTGHLGVLHQVDLASGAVTNLTYPLGMNEFGGYAVAVASTGKVLVSGQGSDYSIPIEEYDPASNSFTHSRGRLHRQCPVELQGRHRYF